MLGFLSDVNMSLMSYLFVIYETIIYNTKTFLIKKSQFELLHYCLDIFWKPKTRFSNNLASSLP
jgi:hypothetical protein